MRKDEKWGMITALIVIFLIAKLIGIEESLIIKSLGISAIATAIILTYIK